MGRIHSQSSQTPRDRAGRCLCYFWPPEVHVHLQFRGNKWCFQLEGPQEEAPAARASCFRKKTKRRGLRFVLRFGGMDLGQMGKMICRGPFTNLAVLGGA